MGYMIAPDPEKMAARRVAFGLVPKHPVLRGKVVVGFSAGKVGPDDPPFEWEGDPTNPPRWCKPADAAAAAAYAAQAKMDDIKAKKRKQLKYLKRQAELAALAAELESEGVVLATSPSAAVGKELPTDAFGNRILHEPKHS